MSVLSGDILRTTCNFTIGTVTQFQNVYHHKRFGVAIYTDQEHVNFIETWAESLYGTLVAYNRDNIEGGLCQVDKIEWDTDEWVIVENVGTFVLGWSPIGGATNLPNQVSPFVVFKTNRPKTVGRKFLFPMTEEAYAGGRLVTLALEDMADYADIAVNNITMAALNYLIPGVPRTGVNSWQEFFVAVVNDLVGTQRRRREGVGI